MNRNDEYYQKKIALTISQKKAWTQLVRAVNKCKKENIYFYQCLEHLGGLNGDNVRDIGDDVLIRGLHSESPQCLQFKDYPSVDTSCSFADDNHYVILDDENF